jgi:hypothetical protein
MRTCAWLACVFTLLAAPAAAQATTEDGIRAMLRGEYEAAIRILQPLAYDAARPDPVAQFFLAILFDAGHGGGAGRAGACGLFVQSAAQAHPFSEQSAAMAAIHREQLGGLASMLCVPGEKWQSAPAQSFVLGPNHRVVFEDTSIRVIHGDQEQHVGFLVLPSNVGLPFQYTTLDVTRPVVVRRHFFQWFVWRPDRSPNPASWTLGWTLSEVVGDRWIPITGEKSLVVVSGRTPPASYPLGDVVRLRVDASGEAELTITGGTVRRTEVIEWRGNR